MHRPFRLLLISVLGLGLNVPSPALTAAASPNRSDEGLVRDFLSKHCVDCHGEAVQESDLRLDALPARFTAETSGPVWEKVLRRLKAGEMPPAEMPRPPADEIKAVTSWIERRLIEDDAARLEREGRIPLRRMTAGEYENTVHDLLQIEAPVGDLLPLDGVAHGFDKVSDALSFSAVQMKSYLQAADAALDAAIARSPPEAAIQRRALLKDEPQVAARLGRDSMLHGDAVLCLQGGELAPLAFESLRVPADGRYRIRIGVWPYQPGKKSLALIVFAGGFEDAGQSRLLDYFDVKGTEEKPHVVEFTERLQAGDTIAVGAYGVWSGPRFRKVQGEKQTLADYPGPGVAIGGAAIEGPLDRDWPPASHKRLFGDLPLKKIGEQRRGGRVRPTYAVSSANPKRDAERLLRAFLPRAFRRPITDEDLQPYLALVHRRLEEGDEFEAAMRVGFKAVLCAPDFLLLGQENSTRDENSVDSEADFALASRLSYFLWATLPDRELLDLAAAGRLDRPDVLREQVDRLLDDPRSNRFLRDFIAQWLWLRRINATLPDAKLYPEYDELLKRSMVTETQRFVAALIQDDLSLLNVVDSDFALLNERMARHYGIDGVRGYEEFRRVPLPADSRRGGIITQASVLKVTANGTTTSPVLRGVWMLENILGDVPPPPPNGVPAVEPDIRGATTIREQLAKHRETGACARCHRKIDPPGFALESYDVIGGWRTHYRSLGKGEEVEKTTKGQPVVYRQGPAVEPGHTLPGGESFEDIDGFKQLVLQEPDRVARCLTEKLMTYAIGRGVSYGDRPDIDRIIERTAAQGYGLRTLIHEIVQSKTFQGKSPGTEGTAKE